MTSRQKPLGTSGQAADTDLDDLLGEKGTAAAAGAGTSSVGINLDHLTRDGDVPRNGAGPSGRSYAQRYDAYYSAKGGVGCLGYASAWCSLFFAARPKCGWLVTMLGVAGFAFCLFQLAFNPSKKIGVVKHDWTSISSIYDLKAGDIDHWCLKGDDSSCRCEDPLQPADRGEYKSWVKAHAENKRLVSQHLNAWDAEPTVDVAFLGESLIEEMDGRWLGMSKGEHLESLAKMYKKHFGPSSTIPGVALGIAGDTAPNVLWRLMHGEMPEDFNPRVWWISLGMNDIARMQCSEEVVIMGILRVVEEIRSRKPDAKIVINSILPMHDMRSGAFPLQNDYQDAFRTGNVGRFSRGRAGGITANRPASHIARAPNKAVQGEREGETDVGKRDKFPKTRRRLDGLDVDATGGTPGPSSLDVDRNLQRGRPMRGKKNLTPAEKRAAELAEKKAKLLALQEKKRVFMQKQLAQRLKRDKVNPVLRDQHKYKQLDPKRLFMRKNPVPLWPAISVINNNLRRFCEKHDHVTFFDATDIFANRAGRTAYMLRSDMISVRGHPTEEGFRAWEGAVAKKLQYMLKTKPGKAVAPPVAPPAPVLPPGNPVLPPPPGQAPESESKVTEKEESAEESESEDRAEESESEEEDAKESESEEEEKEEADESESEEEEEEESASSEEPEEIATPVKKTIVTKKVAAVRPAESEEESGEEEEEVATPVKKTTVTKNAAAVRPAVKTTGTTKTTYSTTTGTRPAVKTTGTKSYSTTTGTKTTAAGSSKVVRPAVKTSTTKKVTPTKTVAAPGIEKPAVKKTTKVTKTVARHEDAEEESDE